MELLTSFLYQLVFTIGIIVVFGLIIAFSRRSIVRLGRAGYRAIIITGVVGTPVHELGHAIACFVFGHKIVEICLYQPNSDDGTLGYVSHSFNPKSIYQQIGNFFIGIAPILFGCAVLIGLMALMLPDIFGQIMAGFNAVKGLEGGLWNAVKEFFLHIVNVLILNQSNFTNAWWYVYMVLALMVSSHMELSGADIVGSLKGLLYLVVIIAIVDTALYLISVPTLLTVTGTVVSASFMVISFLLISLVFSLLMLAIAVVVKIIKGIF
jgi:hypothetical protein